MKYLELAKLKSEGQTTSYDDIVRDIESILERAKGKSHVPKYIIRTLQAARTEILALRR